MRKFNPEKELKKIQHGNRNKIIFGVMALLLIISIGSTYALYQVRYSKRIIYTKVAPFSNYDIDLAVYVNGIKRDTFPTKDEGVTFTGLDCEKKDITTATWNEGKGGLDLFTSGPNKCNVLFNLVKDFNYKGSIEEYVVPLSGIYKLEVWGAQGGTGVGEGGFGGYSTGNIHLTKGEMLYIVVGGAGVNTWEHKVQIGGYNGGGNGVPDGDDFTRQASGGGATHIATVNGLLSELEDYKSDILIVAGGGGGSAFNYAVQSSYGNSGSGGGAIGGIGTWNGNYAYGGTQEGIGESPNDVNCDNTDSIYVCAAFGKGASIFAGGGGGLYGGMGYGYCAAGGSGYIGNKLLTDKAMYCYACEENNEVNTKTIPTENVNANPISTYAKKGNGAAKITYLGIN